MEIEFKVVCLNNRITHNVVALGDDPDDFVESLTIGRILLLRIIMEVLIAT